MDKFGQHPGNYIRTLIAQSAAHDTPYTQDITEVDESMTPNCRVVIEMEGANCRVVEVRDLKDKLPLTEHREKIQAELEAEAEAEAEPEKEQLPTKPDSPTTPKPTPAGSRS